MIEVGRDGVVPGGIGAAQTYHEGVEQQRTCAKCGHRSAGAGGILYRTTRTTRPRDRAGLVRARLIRPYPERQCRCRAGWLQAETVGRRNMPYPPPGAGSA
jgi:hypothetical protein